MVTVIIMLITFKPCRGYGNIYVNVENIADTQAVKHRHVYLEDQMELTHHSRGRASVKPTS